jgi:DNA-binding response OmpR family regulator
MPKKKVLVVDDSAAVQLTVRMALSKELFEVVTASDGHAGLVKALSERPDLILMDVEMPKLNGFEAVRLLRAQEQTRKTPIVMLTSKSEMQSVATAYQCGCNDYVHKPFDGPQLLAKLGTLLGVVASGAAA